MVSPCRGGSAGEGQCLWRGGLPTPGGVPSGFSSHEGHHCPPRNLCAPRGLCDHLLSGLPSQTRHQALSHPSSWMSRPGNTQVHLISFWPLPCPWHYSTWELPGASPRRVHLQTTCSGRLGRVCCLCTCCSGGRSEKVFSVVQKGMRLRLCMASILSPTQEPLQVHNPPSTQVCPASILTPRSPRGRCTTSQSLDVRRNLHLCQPAGDHTPLLSQ